MYIICDIFQLKFGHYRLTRVLTDFTGDSYRLIFEEGYNTLKTAIEKY
jgi:hypothetical protein